MQLAYLFAKPYCIYVNYKFGVKKKTARLKTCEILIEIQRKKSQNTEIKINCNYLFYCKIKTELQDVNS